MPKLLVEDQTLRTRFSTLHFPRAVFNHANWVIQLFQNRKHMGAKQCSPGSGPGSPLRGESMAKRDWEMQGQSGQM